MSTIREMPMQHRAQPVASVNAEARTVEVVWTTGADVNRMDYWTGRAYIERLSTEPSHLRLGRLATGAPLLNTHDQYSLDSVIGVVESVRMEGGRGLATVRFHDDSASDAVFQKVRNGIVRNVSVGYAVHKVASSRGPDDVEIRTAVDWEPLEISFVPIPADPGAQVRALEAGRAPLMYRCEFLTPPAEDDSAQQRKEAPMTTVTTAPPDDSAAIRESAARAERARISEIQSRVASAGLGTEFAQTLIEGGHSVDAACRSIVDALAARQQPTPVATRVSVTEDESVKLRAAVSAALVHRINPGSGALPDNGASEFRYMSMLRLGEEVLRREGVSTRGLSAMQIATRAMHSTSDFPNILADALNKRLRNAYEENIPSYQRWSRRAPNSPDFKTINVTQLSSSPDLQKVLEGGEFTTGKMTDGKETYQVLTYGRVIPVTRQAMINDDLQAFDRVPRLLAGAARRLENRLVYDVLTANAALSDGGALFNNTAITTTGGHANLATGTGSALSLASLTTARAAMRVQKGLANEELNITPSYLIVPAALEQSAYQFTSTNYVPAKVADINEFRVGGRTALEPIVEAYLDANSATAWYLAGTPNQIDTIEWCYLDGNEGLMLESQMGFEIDGISVKARLDFGCAAIDYRGLYKANGA